jgi:hypothetical protein
MDINVNTLRGIYIRALDRFQCRFGSAATLLFDRCQDGALDNGDERIPAP